LATFSYSRHRFPPLVIQHSIWLNFKFSLSYRDFEDLLVEQGIDVSYETIRRWVLKFGATYALKLNKSRPRPSGRWYLDEVSVSINGARSCL
jgi:putative transposase